MDPKDLSSTPWYLDKSWYLAALALIAPLVAKYLGVQLDAATIVAVIVPVVGFIVSSKAKQSAVLTAQINNGHFDNPPTPVSLEVPAPVAPVVVIAPAPVPAPAPAPVLACVTCGTKLTTAEAAAHTCPVK